MQQKPRLFCLVLALSLCLGGLPSPLAAAEEGDFYLAYVREVGNQLYLSDFQLGSQEAIRDQDGHGTALGWLLNYTGYSFWNFEIGRSTTLYQGRVEDGVNVDFSPQAGSGYGAVSESKNIYYDVDLTFDNPYFALQYTNWLIPQEALKQGYWAPSTFVIGVIQQKAQGEVSIKAKKVEIATAEYDSGNRKYYALGWSFKWEFVYFGIIFRNVQQPMLQITSCNEAAVGSLACERINAATGNRNQTAAVFNGGLLQLGMFW